jgi:hypothetical protein
MKAFFLISLFFCTLYTANSTPCLAADKAADKAADEAAVQSASTAQEEVRARITRAKQTKRVLEVALDNGAVIKGTVQEVAAEHFKLKEFNSQFIRDIRFTEINSVKEQSRFATAMRNAGKVLSFLFLSRTGIILTSAALTVARFVIWQKKINSRGRVLITP